MQRILKYIQAFKRYQSQFSIIMDMFRFQQRQKPQKQKTTFEPFQKQAKNSSNIPSNYQAMKLQLKSQQRPYNPFQKRNNQRSQTQLIKANQQHFYGSSKIKFLSNIPASGQTKNNFVQTKLSNFFSNKSEAKQQKAQQEKIFQNIKQTSQNIKQVSSKFQNVSKPNQQTSKSIFDNKKLKYDVLQIIRNKNERQLQGRKNLQKTQLKRPETSIEVSNENGQSNRRLKHYDQEHKISDSRINFDVNLFTQMGYSKNKDSFLNLLIGQKFKQKVPQIVSFKYSSKPQQHEKQLNKDQQQFTPQSSYYSKKVQEDSQRSDRKSQRIEKYQKMKKLKKLKKLNHKHKNQSLCQKKSGQEDDQSQMFEQDDKQKQPQYILKRDMKIAKMRQKWNQKQTPSCQLQYGEEQYDVFDMIENNKGLASAVIKIVDGTVYYSLQIDIRGSRRLVDRQTIVKVNPIWLLHFYKMRV